MQSCVANAGMRGSLLEKKRFLSILSLDAFLPIGTRYVNSRRQVDYCHRNLRFSFLGCRNFKINNILTVSNNCCKGGKCYSCVSSAKGRHCWLNSVHNGSLKQTDMWAHILTFGCQINTFPL